MIREELFVQRGKELDVASTDPDVRAAMVNSVELEIAADAVTSQPSEAQLRGLLRRAPGALRERRRHDPARLRISRRANPRRRPQRPRRCDPAPRRRRLAGARVGLGKDGARNFISPPRFILGEALFDAARDLPDGGVSAPIAAADAIHVLYMDKNTKPVPFDFGSARDQVLTDYRNDAIGHLRTGDEAFLRKRANVLIADDIRR